MDPNTLRELDLRLELFLHCHQDAEDQKDLEGVVFWSQKLRELEEEKRQLCKQLEASILGPDDKKRRRRWFGFFA